MRQSTDESPNICMTHDFKTFAKLSDIEPQARCNWLKSELISFKQLDGKETQGVLYKPENFYPSKKYPVIIYYYEKFSQDLNAFHKPEFSQSSINIPWLVSRGYLVFTPDIYYTIREPGQSAYNSIIGATNCLISFPWIDSAKIALHGHSFGGYETNFLVTRTARFSAALSASGLTNLISDYGSVDGLTGRDFHFRYENSQWQFGATLWERARFVYFKFSRF